jgi:hypothetical protein
MLNYVDYGRSGENVGNYPPISQAKSKNSWSSGSGKEVFEIDHWDGDVWKYFDQASTGHLGENFF